MWAGQLLGDGYRGWPRDDAGDGGKYGSGSGYRFAFQRGDGAGALLWRFVGGSDFTDADLICGGGSLGAVAGAGAGACGWVGFGWADGIVAVGFGDYGKFCEYE